MGPTLQRHPFSGLVDSAGIVHHLSGPNTCAHAPPPRRGGRDGPVVRPRRTGEASGSHLGRRAAPAFTFIAPRRLSCEPLTRTHQPDSGKTRARRAGGRYRPHTVHGLGLDQKDLGPPRAAPGSGSSSPPRATAARPRGRATDGAARPSSLGDKHPVDPRPTAGSGHAARRGRNPGESAQRRAAPRRPAGRRRGTRPRGAAPRATRPRREPPRQGEAHSPRGVPPAGQSETSETRLREGRKGWDNGASGHRAPPREGRSSDNPTGAQGVPTYPPTPTEARGAHAHARPDGAAGQPPPDGRAKTVAWRSNPSPGGAAPRGPAAAPRVPRRAEGTVRARRPGRTGAEDEGGGGGARAPPQALDPPSAGKAGLGRAETRGDQGRRAKGARRGDGRGAKPPAGKTGRGARRGHRGGAGKALRHPPPLPPGDPAPSCRRGRTAGLPTRPSGASYPLAPQGPFSPRAHSSLVPRDQRAGTAPARPRRTDSQVRPSSQRSARAVGRPRRGRSEGLTKPSNRHGDYHRKLIGQTFEWVVAATGGVRSARGYLESPKPPAPPPPGRGRGEADREGRGTRSPGGPDVPSTEGHTRRRRAAAAAVATPPHTERRGPRRGEREDAPRSPRPSPARKRRARRNGQGPATADEGTPAAAPRGEGRLQPPQHTHRGGPDGGARAGPAGAALPRGRGRGEPGRSPTPPHTPTTTGGSARPQGPQRTAGTRPAPGRARAPERGGARRRAGGTAPRRHTTPPPGRRRQTRMGGHNGPEKHQRAGARHRVGRQTRGGRETKARRQGAWAPETGAATGEEDRGPPRGSTRAPQKAPSKARARERSRDARGRRPASAPLARLPHREPGPTPLGPNPTGPPRTGARLNLRPSV
ncbi:collagen alpha-1(I) chain-like [Mustela putorius furo]|uniref:Collagen alpha-1(I) chain-like n=1 Tax=Mustela putorius furo TaxID=9669 RepID=A0A8U0SKS4_MUSPF|nr:collagen alpha-1(I) chain-like [Mustela putorius furo]